MARPNYMTMAVSDTVQGMFSEFVTRKGITKTAALNDMLELYMLTADERLYLELKRKYLNADVIKNLLADRDSTQPAPEFLFMKLGESTLPDGTRVSARQMMQIYQDDLSRRGYTWFSTESLFYGMSPARVKQFNQKIRAGQRIRILFAINDNLCDNDIDFSADVLEVFSAKTSVRGPEPGACPAEFQNEQARIWLKLENLAPEAAIRASMLQITSTGSDLKQTINNAQYHFGYVSFKD